MKKMIMICMAVVTVNFSVYSQNISPAKRQDILKMIEVTEMRAQMTQMFDLMFTSMLESMGPGVSDNLKTAIKSKFQSSVDDLINSVVPVYDKHLTHDDIKQIVRFYESSVGKKMIKVTPLITQEAFAIGEKWGQNLAQDIVAELMKLQR